MMINAKLFDQSILFTNNSRIVTNSVDILSNMFSKKLKLYLCIIRNNGVCLVSKVNLSFYYLKRHIQNTKSTRKDGIFVQLNIKNLKRVFILNLFRLILSM